jgi:hypothetical protein
MNRRLLVAALAIVVVPFAAPAVSQAPVAQAQVTGCDPVDAAACLLPFPNDYFTVPDASKATGIRVSFDRSSMP